ncbi:MAG: sulfotransferase [Sulfuricella sp.]|nr:sulfotransferase [Sulfuricella sp.]
MFPYSAQPTFSIDSLLRQCAALAAEGQPAAAIDRLKDARPGFPRHAGLLEALAGLLRRAGRDEEAIEPLSALVSLEPGNHLRQADLATLYYALNRLPDAERHARQAMALNPLNAQAHNLMGMIYLDIHHPEEAEFHFRQLLLMHEPLAPVTANLASALKSMGKLDEAETFFRHTLELDPNNIEGCLNWARMEEARRNMPRAWELLEQAEKIEPRHLGAAVTRAVLLRREKKYADALAILDEAQAIHGDTLPPSFHFEHGAVLDKLGRHDEAFAAYDTANRLARELGHHHYQAAHHEQLAGRLKSFFVRQRIAPIIANQAPDKPSAETPRPLFIIGFPRSGTTMTEQILASHANISAGDELDYLYRLTTLAPHLCGSAKPYPECLEELGRPGKGRAIEKFRDYYVCNAELRRVIEKGKKRFTDKMPLNEQHMGLIHLTFPSAPIIHLIRHPLDVVLSTFFTDLTHGGNCSYQLETTARHYALTFDLIEHYRRELDLKYLPIRYEEVVAEPERHVRLLLDFVGEPYDENCVAFHNNQRYARTASYAQVSEKLYTSSRFRYRNYRKHLETIIPILMPAIERLGYGID